MSAGPQRGNPPAPPFAKGEGGDLAAGRLVRVYQRCVDRFSREENNRGAIFYWVLAQRVCYKQDQIAAAKACGLN